MNPNPAPCLASVARAMGQGPGWVAVTLEDHHALMASTGQPSRRHRESGPGFRVAWCAVMSKTCEPEANISTMDGTGKQYHQRPPGRVGLVGLSVHAV